MTRPPPAAARGLPTWSRRRYAQAWRERGAIGGDLTYVALGDSAAQGLGAARPDLGYVGLLAELAREHSGRTVRVVNLGVSGARTRDVVADQLPLLPALHADIVTCAVGGNDVRRLEPDSFEQDVRDLVGELPSHALVADVPCFYGGPLEVRARQAAEIVRRTVDEMGRIRIDLHAATEARTREEVRRDFALDRFHPNNRGYTVWAAAFAPALVARIDALDAIEGSAGDARP